MNARASRHHELVLSYRSVRPGQRHGDETFVLSGRIGFASKCCVNLLANGVKCRILQIIDLIGRICNEHPPQLGGCLSHERWIVLSQRGVGLRQIVVGFALQTYLWR